MGARRDVQCTSNTYRKQLLNLDFTHSQEQLLYNDTLQVNSLNYRIMHVILNRVVTF